ncbi:MAG: cytochrome c3 family protein [Deltaproteobacteria bacterium]|nr:cytochrome c3 family protein [Deltaproteobacteria bacterium]
MESRVILPILVCISLLLIPTYGFLSDNPDQLPDVIIFESSLGPVSFHHDRHLKETREDCTVCHHAAKSPVRSCRRCHKHPNETGAGDPLPFYEVKMTFCRDCHRTRNNPEDREWAPVSCRGCHDVKQIKW